MATSLTARFDLHVRAPLVQDNPAASSPASIDSLVNLSSSDVTKRHHKVYTVAASGAQSIDIAGSATDAYGTVLTFSKVKAIVVRNRSTAATAAATVERPASGVPFISTAATVAVDPVAILVNKAGWTVTAGTGDLIAVNNADSAASADIEVLILGT